MSASVTPPAGAEPRWLVEVRLRARRRMLWCRELWAHHRYAGEEALAITHSEVELALEGAGDLRRAEELFQIEHPDARKLTEEIESLSKQVPDPRWVHLCDELELSAAERELLSLALASELVPALRRVYGYLRDEVAPADPSPALVADLWGWSVPPRVDRESALVRYALAHPAGQELDETSNATGWAADPLVLDYLLDQGPAVYQAPLGQPVEVPKGPQLHRDEFREIVVFIDSIGPGNGSVPPVEIELVAPAGSGRTTLAAQVAAKLGRRLVAVDSREIAAAAQPEVAAAREARCARLAGALIAWQEADSLPDRCLQVARRCQPLCFLTTEKLLPITAQPAAIRHSSVLTTLSRGERLELWHAVSARPAPEPVAQWPLRASEVRLMAQVAPAGDEALRSICQRLLLEIPHELLERMPQPYTWDDFVVAPHLERHLREIEAQVRTRAEVLDQWGFSRLTPMGRGVTAIFAGPSGTGKTMAAQVLARSLGLELYRVDLAGVVNKYIGETEKHLRSVFAACERAPVMLFFDEADALFGRRMQVSDAHDRFANIEIDYLLQRMEQFDGVAILATNRKGDLDTAFMRRLRFAVDFAPPTVPEREVLWRRALDGAVTQTGLPLTGEIDWVTVARELDLTGAGIKSAALAAAFLARAEGTQIMTRHVAAAARRELEKHGIVVRVTGMESEGA